MQKLAILAVFVILSSAYAATDAEIAAFALGTMTQDSIGQGAALCNNSSVTMACQLGPYSSFDDLDSKASLMFENAIQVIYRYPEVKMVTVLIADQNRNVLSASEIFPPKNLTEEGATVLQ